AVFRLEAGELAREGRPEAAMARLEQGIRLAREGRVREEILRGELFAPILLWQAGDPRAAFARARRAVAGVERLLTLQPLARDRAGLELHWLDAAYALARLLVESGEADLGIEILERMRNRSVLAGLAGAAQGVTGPELAEVRARIAELQRRLLRDDAAGLRAEVIGRLEQLEQQEEALLVRLGAVTLESPAPPTLVRLQAALSPETALLSFQVPVWSDAESRFDGAWLLCIDRVAIRVFALPDPADLRRAVDAFDGLLGRNDRAARHAASRLYGELLAPALAELAPSVRRLVLIPDGPLHRLAFAALSAGELEPPLGASFELERASSFAAWLATVDPALPPRTAAALVLADPEVTEVDGPAPRRSLVKLDAATLGRLAGARREAAAVARLFGESAHVLLGTGASEHALKSVDLSRVGLVHIAAHALVDDQRPYRSAILLAPGGGEDGLLQMRDIVGLRLDGAIVVLASCRSGDGARFAGEGIFSLARAFLDAGASAVVANLEAVDDLESSALLEPLFRGLRRGLPVRSALAEARRSGFEAAQSTAWATTVLLGDGDARLVPAAAGGSWPGNGIWALAVALLLAVGVLSTKLRPRRRRQ
ncbi:MAG TPA: CHAT domain-containing protein, partial [Thermoanaerobaculia bacterium]|nr:CHAT domain-containing protein [Thermoanaerobaculia bacterium]